MQLNIETDYAVRTVLYLTDKDGYEPSARIADQMVIDREILKKILHRLQKAGIVVGRAGSEGGYALSRPAENISLLSVIETMEGTVKINRCLEKDGYCSRKKSGSCAVHKFYASVQNMLEQAFGNTTIRDLYEGNTVFDGLDGK